MRKKERERVRMKQRKKGTVREEEGRGKERNESKLGKEINHLSPTGVFVLLLEFLNAKRRKKRPKKKMGQCGEYGEERGWNLEPERIGI